jgi:hypothetical protein
MAEWHHIFGHPNDQRLLLQAKAVKGIEIIGVKEYNCKPCGISKSSRTISRVP